MTTARLQEQLAAAELDRDRWRRGRDTIEANFQAFKDKVRTEAIEVAERQDWCNQGLNDTLERLGLDAFHREWVGTVQVQIRVRVRNGDSESQAMRWARDALTHTSNDGDVVVEESDIDFVRLEEAEH